MDYSGYTWLFKSPGNKITIDEVRQALVDLGSQKVGGWDLTLKQYSNQTELVGQADMKSLARVYTINDSVLPSHIAILMHKNKRVAVRLTSVDFRIPQDHRIPTENSRSEASRLYRSTRLQLSTRRHPGVIRSDHQEQRHHQRDHLANRTAQSSLHDQLRGESIRVHGIRHVHDARHVDESCILQRRPSV